MSPAQASGVKHLGAPAASPPRLLDRVREAVRVRHYSIRTESAYVDWVRRYIHFHGRRHPQEMGAAEVTAFLTALAVERKVSASTQSQAKSALLFLYRRVLGVELPWLDEVRVAEHRRGLLVEGVEFERRELPLRCGKAGQNRVTMPPEHLVLSLGLLCLHP